MNLYFILSVENEAHLITILKIFNNSNILGNFKYKVDSNLTDIEIKELEIIYRELKLFRIWFRY